MRSPPDAAARPRRADMPPAARPTRPRPPSGNPGRAGTPARGRYAAIRPSRPLRPSRRTRGACTPADRPPPASATAADVTDAEIDSFAKATVKLQEIQADASIAAEQKQTAMAAAVTEAGLDPAKYNAIGRAAQSDAELRAKVQTAMSKYAGPRPSEG